jgi:hypothetical protein
MSEAFQSLSKHLICKTSFPIAALGYAGITAAFTFALPSIPFRWPPRSRGMLLEANESTSIVAASGNFSKPEPCLPDKPAYQTSRCSKIPDQPRPRLYQAVLSDIFSLRLAKIKGFGRKISSQRDNV